MQLPTGIGDDHPDDGVEAVAIMPDLHSIPGLWSPVDGYSVLLKRLEVMRLAGKIGKLLSFPYDWRLSNRYNGQRLADLVGDELGQWRDSDPSRNDAQLVLVCHSMGGLIARWYIEKCGGAEVTRKLVTLGTPHRGAAKTIDQLINGVRRTLGPLSVDLTSFARSLPSSYQLLPDYACIDRSGSLHRLDEINMPGLDTAMLADSNRFYRDLAAAEAARPASMETTHVIVGTRQSTSTTVRLTSNGVEVLSTIGGDNDYGDATVPMAGAIKEGLPMDTPFISRVVDRHGHLQDNPYVLDEIESVITAVPVKRRAGGSVPIRVNTPELVVLGEPVTVTVDIELGEDQPVPAVQIELEPESSLKTTRLVRRTPTIRGRHLETTFHPEAPGAYQLRVTGTAPGSPVTPVGAAILVWQTETNAPSS
ncbi:esterase/lipase family protein [[Mycobacterium] manitobense]|uniref:esterase/lipase family protein n=1 Tax=[Mycobacterium] manitobense TaxID=190147 RepID=UPI0021F34056|nr:hypothetical protein [[Mycobacterium] manitobense]